MPWVMICVQINKTLNPLQAVKFNPSITEINPVVKLNPLLTCLQGGNKGE